MADEPASGGIEIRGNAVGSALITGNGNTVTIVYAADVLRAAGPLAANPYRGLAAFDEASAAFFHGRERLVAGLLARVQRLAAPTEPSMRFLAITGPSGCGKSSVARAGLVPALGGSAAPWLRGARVVILRPGARPIDALADALARLATGEVDPAATRAAFAGVLRADLHDRQRAGLARLLRDHVAGPGPLLLLIDQFEELYTQAPAGAERDGFIGMLLQTAQASDPLVVVVITLRSDFLGALAASPMLSRAVADSHELVPALGRDDLRRAVSEPARTAGQPIDAAVVERILDQAEGQPAVLPLVQFAMEQIWERMRDGTAPGETLATLDGVGGALASRADEVFAARTDADQRLAQRCFLATVQPGDIAARDTRRRCLLDEVRPAGIAADALRRAVEPFVAARLLATGANAEDAIWFELPHEALIRSWDRLRGWLDTQRDDLRYGREVMQAAERWQAAQRPRGSLWRRPDLDLLQRFAARNALTELQTAFLAASEGQARRQRWLIRAAVGAMLALALIAGGSAWVAEQRREVADAQRMIAEQRGRESLARQLDATARNLAGTEYSTALLLAAQASRTDDTPDTRAALFTLLQQNFYLDHYLRAPLTNHFSGAVGPRSPGVAVSPDGRVVASLGREDDGDVQLWDAAKRRPLGPPLHLHAVSVSALAFSPDGTLLASAAADGVVVLDLASKAVRDRLSFNTANRERTAESIGFSADGGRLAIGTSDTDAKSAAIYVWDLAGGHPVQTIEIPARTGYDAGFGITKLQFLPDGRRLLAGVEAFSGENGLRTGLRLFLTGKAPDHDPGFVETIDLASAQPVGRPIEGCPVAMSADGGTVVTLSADAKVMFAYPGTDAKPVDKLTASCGRGAFSSDGTRLGLAQGTSLQFVDLTASRLYAAEMPDAGTTVDSLAFSADGTRAYVSDYNNGLTAWRIGNGRSLGRRLARVPDLAPAPQSGVGSVEGSGDPQSTAGPSWLSDVVFSHDGRWIATTDLGGHGLLLWRPGSHVPDFAVKLNGEIQRFVMRVSGDPPTLLALMSDGTVRFVNPAHPDSATVLAHDASGIASARTADVWALARKNGTVEVHDGAAATPRITLDLGAHGEIGPIALDAAARTLAVHLPDGSVGLWDAADGRQQRILPSPPGGRQAADQTLAFSPDGATLLGLGSGQAVLWSRISGEIVNVGRSKSDIGGPMFGDISPDLVAFALASVDDPEVQLLHSDQAGDFGPALGLYAPPADIEGTAGVAFSPEGHTLAAAYLNGDLVLWDFRVATWLQSACAIANRDLSETTWRRFGVFDAPDACPDRHDR